MRDDVQLRNVAPVFGALHSSPGFAELEGALILEREVYRKRRDQQDAQVALVHAEVHYTRRCVSHDAFKTCYVRHRQHEQLQCCVVVIMMRT